jgi:thiamine kinase-like enzyme
MKWSVQDKTHINGKDVSMDELFDKIDWDWLTNGVPVLGHGDLNFGNAILTPDSSHLTNHFRLIDWREEFADQNKYIDVYYDLAKLYAGADVSWMKIHENMQWAKQFINKKQTCVSISTDWFMRTTDLKLFKKLYEKWIVDNGYDLKKVKTIAALIYLNMSPLHGKEMGEFLFFLALERLSHVIVH